VVAAPRPEGRVGRCLAAARPALLARCVLDAANNSYYHLPFLIALAAWEALQRERPPVLSVGAAGLVCSRW
jgi:hypothetical protein